MKLRSSTYPLGHILNPATPYTNAAETDLKAKFDKIRAEQAKKQDEARVLRPQRWQRD